MILRTQMQRLLLLLILSSCFILTSSSSSQHASSFDLASTRTQLLSLALHSREQPSSSSSPSSFHLLALSYTLTFTHDMEVMRYLNDSTSSSSSPSPPSSSSPSSPSSSPLTRRYASIRDIFDEDEDELNQLFRLECPGIGTIAGETPTKKMEEWFHSTSKPLASAASSSLTTLLSSPSSWPFFLWTYAREDSLPLMFLSLFEDLILGGESHDQEDGEEAGSHEISLVLVLPAKMESKQDRRRGEALLSQMMQECTIHIVESEDFALTPSSAASQASFLSISHSIPPDSLLILPPHSLDVFMIDDQTEATLERELIEMEKVDDEQQTEETNETSSSSSSPPLPPHHPHAPPPPLNMNFEDNSFVNFMSIMEQVKRMHSNEKTEMNKTTSTSHELAQQHTPFTKGMELGWRLGKQAKREEYDRMIGRRKRTHPHPLPHSSLPSSSSILSQPFMHHPNHRFNTHTGKVERVPDDTPISMIEIQQHMNAEFNTQTDAGVGVYAETQSMITTGISTGFVMQLVYEGMWPIAWKKAFEQLNNVVQKYGLPILADKLGGDYNEPGGLKGKASKEKKKKEKKEKKEKEEKDKEIEEETKEEKYYGATDPSAAAEGGGADAKAGGGAKKGGGGGGKGKKSFLEASSIRIDDTILLEEGEEVDVDVDEDMEQPSTTPTSFSAQSSQQSSDTPSLLSTSSSSTTSKGGYSGLGKDPGMLAKAISKDLLSAAPKWVKPTVEGVVSLLKEELHVTLCDELRDELAHAISTTVQIGLQKNLPSRLGNRIAPSLAQWLPQELSKTLSETLTHTLTRSVTHALSYTLYYSLTHSPNRQYHCHYCITARVLSSCSICYDKQDTAYQMPPILNQYQYYYQSYFSDYYASLYAGTPEKEDGSKGKQKKKEEKRELEYIDGKAKFA